MLKIYFGMILRASEKDKGLSPSRVTKILEFTVNFKNAVDYVQ